MQPELQGLKERFDDAFNVTEAKDFFIALTECLRFISDTPTLNAVAKKVLTEKYAGITTSSMGKLYSALNKAWLEDYNVAEKIWYGMCAKFVGKSSEFDVPILFTDYQNACSSARIFYDNMLGILKDSENSRFGKIPIVIDKAETRLYLANSIERCYSIRNTQKDKSKLPKRFEVITILLRENKGVSATRLIELLKGKSDITNLKREIRGINNNFRAKVTDMDLIDTNEQGNKNIYTLNKNKFHFRLENSRKKK